MSETLLIETDARGVATVTLNRPGKHNALSSRMIEELTEAAHALGQNPDVKVIVLTGAGASFCAGGDLGWMRDQMEADATARAREARKLAMMLAAWNRCPKPVIAKVQGPAYGGGVGLICTVDLAIAVDSARFGFTETRLGLIPATIGPHVMARLGAAGRQVFTSGGRFGIETALRLGLFARAVAPDVLDAAVEAEIKPYLSAAPQAVAAAKKLALSLCDPVSEAQIEASVAALIAQWETPTAREGIAAFFGKRTPVWPR